jgi:ERCC4-type nuclease
MEHISGPISRVMDELAGRVSPAIIIDSREPDPSPWQDYFTVPAIRQKLDTGDYSLLGCAEWIALERKSIDDLVSCLSHSRDRFVEELHRAQRIPDFYVICECSYRDILSGRYRSEMKGRAAWESIIALQQRFRIPFLFAGDVATAAELGQSILLRWFREHEKVLENVRLAQKRLAKAG